MDDLNLILEKLTKLESILENFNQINPKGNVGRICLIRSVNSGVHFGKVIDEFYTPVGKSVILKDSRRIHYWSGAASLTQVANDGIGNKEISKISQKISKIEIVDVCEMLPMSNKAIKQLDSHPVWEIKNIK